MSEVAIINLALTEIGSTRRIIDRQEGTAEAKAADTVFDHHRDRLLRSHIWNFATRRAQLARSARIPSHQWAHQHFLPPDFMRAIVVSASERGSQNILYDLAHDENDGHVVLSDSEDLWLTYVGKVTDTEQMPPDFQHALATSIAIPLASALKQSNTTMDIMERRHREAVVAAKSTDGIETWAQQFPVGSWVTARHGGRSGW